MLTCDTNQGWRKPEVKLKTDEKALASIS